MIDDIVERHLDEKKGEVPNQAYDKLRKPTAPPTKPHKDKNRYSRKDKHKKKYDE